MSASILFTSLPPGTQMGAGITLQTAFDDRCQQPIRPVHSFPVVLIGRSTRQTYLIMTAVVVDARPREPVRTSSPNKLLEEVQWVTTWFRLFQ
jgi:hypothetical protein